MTTVYFIYPALFLIAIVCAVYCRSSYLLRLLLVFGITLFTLAAMNMQPGISARILMQEDTYQTSEDYRSAVLAMKEISRKGQYLLIVPIIALALLALVPYKQKESQQETGGDS